MQAQDSCARRCRFTLTLFLLKQAQARFFLLSLYKNKNAGYNSNMADIAAARRDEMIYQSIEELIGKTPLLRLHGMERRFGARAEVLAKLEF